MFGLIIVSICVGILTGNPVGGLVWGVLLFGSLLLELFIMEM